MFISHLPPSIPPEFYECVSVGSRAVSWDSSYLSTAEHGSLPDEGFMGCDVLLAGDKLDVENATGNLCHVARSQKWPLAGFLYFTLPENAGLCYLTHQFTKDY